MKLKKKLIIFGAAAFLLAAIIFFLGFTSIGYLVTIPSRGFTQIQDIVFIDNDYNKPGTEAIIIIEEAKTRLLEFWGDIKSKPIIIISDNEKKLGKMGLTQSPAITTSFAFQGAHNYIVLSADKMNVDIVAHELTHAELYTRLYAGKTFSYGLVPMWFNEGLATQNDYREIYNDDAWTEATNNGQNITNFDDLVSARQFFDDNTDIRRYNYIISRYEVKKWLEKHNMKALLSLINDVNAGKDFKNLYYAKQS